MTICITWWQPTCSMSTRMFVPGHQPGLLFVFYRLWDQHACPCARAPAQLGARRMATPSRPHKRGRAKEEIQSQRPCGAKAAAHKRGQLGRAAAPPRKRAAAAPRRCRCAPVPVRGRGSGRRASIGSVTVGCQAEHFWWGEREMHCPAITGILEVGQGLGGNTHLPPQGQC